ncbi:MAG: acyl carrier protein [Gemmatimonadetes bacterium]|nr:acyl carrier protein [Gemmatimonadota bacterium]
MSAPRTSAPDARARFIDETAAWIVRRFAPGAVLEADTPLFEGLIDSIRILELIAWTERALGGRIPDRMIRMDHFRTLRAVAETFIPDAESEDTDVER